jgi:uncharacterized membrane protein YdbT with pleckstrin-like domain
MATRRSSSNSSISVPSSGTNENQSELWAVAELKNSLKQLHDDGFEKIDKKIEIKFKEIREDFKERVDELVEKQASEAKELINKELGEVRNSVIGTIALFAAFFTFVSVDVVVLKDQAEQKIGLFAKFGVILVIWFCLMGFIFTFFLFIRERERHWQSWLPIAITFALALGTFPIMKAFGTF